MNLVSAANNPKKLARGTLSKIENLKNIKRKGMSIPPPPSPPALAKIEMIINAAIPKRSSIVGGNSNSLIGNYRVYSVVELTTSVINYPMSTYYAIIAFINKTVCNLYIIFF